VLVQSFGVAEGGLVTEYREMAAAAGLAPLDFVPPGGESEQQVSGGSRLVYNIRRITF